MASVLRQDDLRQQNHGHPGEFKRQGDINPRAYSEAHWNSGHGAEARLLGKAASVGSIPSRMLNPERRQSPFGRTNEEH